MDFPTQLKSKKILLGLGAVVVMGAVFFMFQLMSSGVTEKDVPRTRSKSSPRAAVKTTPKSKTNEQTQSPLFEAMEALRDPFRTEDPKTAELESKLSLTQKEIEYLKATLEEKKLRQEIRELERSLAEWGGEG
jgi:flagellar basal body-associated protein FliL